MRLICSQRKHPLCRRDYVKQLFHRQKLESGLFCELTDKELKDSYVEYTLLYDTIANRITISANFLRDNFNTPRASLMSEPKAVKFEYSFDISHHLPTLYMS